MKIVIETFFSPKFHTNFKKILNSFKIFHDNNL